MSQRGRPGNAQSSSSQPRLTMEGAEALLWHKRTHEDQAYLLGRMRELEEQHRDYDARIQATETIAEAAEAATSRVRRIEQQVAAIESDEQDRPFDKWAEGEISGFKSYIEKNKNVRQKQIELDEKFSRLEDSVDKAKDSSKDVSSLLSRIARLETDHISDANRIRSLEADVTSLTLLRQDWAAEEQLPRGTNGRQPAKQMLPPPSQQPPRPLSAEGPEDEETEDEEGPITPFPTEQAAQQQEQGQIPRNPEISSKSDSDHHALFDPSDNHSSSSFMPPSSPTKGLEMNARLRMMQRKSINEPKRSRESGQMHDRQTSAISNSRSLATPASLPATQIVNRKTPATSILGEDFSPRTSIRGSPAKSSGIAPSSASRSVVQANVPPSTQIVNRQTPSTSIHSEESQSRPSIRGSPAKSSALVHSSASRSAIQANAPPAATQIVKKPTAGKAKHVKAASPVKPVPDKQRPEQLIVRIPTRKRKLDEDSFSPRLTRSQARKSQDTIHVNTQDRASQDVVPVVEDHTTKEPAAKRQKANDTSSKATKGMSSRAEATPNAASLVKASPRKAAPSAAKLPKTSPQKGAGPRKRQNCDSCSRRHRKCDHARPACGECTKTGRSEICVYLNQHNDQDQLDTSMPASPEKKVAKGKFIMNGSPKKSASRTGFHEDLRSDSKTLSTANTSSPSKGSSSPMKGISSRKAPVVISSSRRAAAQDTMAQPLPRATKKTLPGSKPTPYHNPMPEYDEYVELHK